MTPQRWQAIRPILESALELEPARRVEFLDGAGIDSESRQEIDSLLASHDRAGDALEVAAFPNDLGQEARFRLLAGKRIGAFRIESEIAVGGMGAVYRAVRDDGQYTQHVAVKIVRAELGGDFAAARFKLERQILANLDHPNIAKIFDGGVTNEGIPYLVMELIDGLPITEYCDQHRLSIEERLALFRTVCSAVHYAHGHLVVHRDIKPSNILVTEAGIPKLLDFGIAKVIDSETRAKDSEPTLIGHVLMTPEYASPEQIRGDAVTVATDIYSLGLILYKLLTGAPALPVASRTPYEIARTVTEQEPTRPSLAVAHRAEKNPLDERSPEVIAELRNTTPSKLQRGLRGDLDNIIGKALRKKPDERYASVDQFSEDLRRHLNSEPVQARKRTFGYQVGRFVARHRIAVGAAVAVTLALVAGLAVALYEAKIAHEHELTAEHRFNEVRGLANSMLFEVNNSIRNVPGTANARKLIIERAQQYLANLADDSTVDAKFLRELAGAYSQLAAIQGDYRAVNVGDTSAAADNMKRSIALRERVVSLEPRDKVMQRELAQSYMGFAYAIGRVGDLQARKNYLQKAIDILESNRVDADDINTEETLAGAYERKAQSIAAEGDYRQSLDFDLKADAIYRKLSAAKPDSAGYLSELSFSHKHIGSLLIKLNQLPEALERYQQAGAIDERLLTLAPQNAEHRYNITFTYSDTGYILSKQGNVDAALDNYRKALAIRSELAAADPNDARAKSGVATTLGYIGNNLVKKKDYVAAIDSYKKSLALRDSLSQKDSSNEELRAAVGGVEQSIGNAYMEIAFTKGESPENRIGNCRQSRQWNERALNTYASLKSRGDSADIKEEIEEIKGQLQRCDTVLTRTH